MLSSSARAAVLAPSFWASSSQPLQQRKTSCSLPSLFLTLIFTGTPMEPRRFFEWTAQNFCSSASPRSSSFNLARLALILASLSAGFSAVFDESPCPAGLLSAEPAQPAKRTAQAVSEIQRAMFMGEAPCCRASVLACPGHQHKRDAVLRSLLRF